MLELGQYSLGLGDRFGHQAKAQLHALMQAGVPITPVWNKSHREHTLIGSRPADVRRAAQAAVAEVGWRAPYFVDADHIGLKNVDHFLDACDFYTLDVADFIGRADFSGGAIDEATVRAFCDRHADLIGAVEIPGLARPFELTPERLAAMARQYLPGTAEAGRIYRHIEKAKGAGNFITEVSMDETDTPQTPEELLVILAALADEGIPVQTLAPKFSGRFNKGVEYAGNAARFAREFEEDLCVIDFAVRRFDLPRGLKLSVHSGSDKFALYPIMRAALRRHGAGVHLKTAGTNWLEELIGLAESGGGGLKIVKEIYAQALVRREELCQPYATVVEIDPAGLPSAAEVDDWSGEQFAAALRHDQACPAYNPNLRQLLHVAFRLAAAMGARYTTALEQHEAMVARNVTTNLLARHIRPLFMDEGESTRSD